MAGGQGFSWFVLHVTTEHVEPIPDQIPGGGHRPGQFGPISVDFQTEIEIGIAVFEPFSVEKEIGITASKSLEIIAAVGIMTVKEISLNLSIARQPACKWSKLLADDEALLAAL